jgi:hypothetical protein
MNIHHTQVLKEICNIDKESLRRNLNYPVCHEDELLICHHKIFNKISVLDADGEHCTFTSQGFQSSLLPINPWHIIGNF